MNEISRLLQLASNGQTPQLTPNAPPTPFWQRWKQKRETAELYKAAGQAVFERYEKSLRVEEQGTVVNATMDAFGMYDSADGVQERTAVTFENLRRMSHWCEPLAAIINTRVLQVGAFAGLPESKRGYYKKPGFRIRLADPEEKPTAADKTEMKRIRDFFLETGFTEPPRDERPMNWEPGFKAFTAQVIRDTLTLDAVSVRRWGSEKKRRDGTPVIPIMAFAALDPGLIRRVRRPLDEVKDGVARTHPWQGERTNVPRGEEIAFVRLAEADVGSGIVENFTSRELAYAIRNPRTDKSANGYGYSEAEQAMNAIMIWINSREYNASRFEKDSLPRGILTILAQLNEQQFASFKQHWGQMFGGANKRWFNPILKGNPNAGSAVNWLPIDMSSREMEYHQFMFSVALWMHALYSIHPEETGFEGLSPFKAPLSEASPETKLTYSQDKGLGALLTWYEEFLNRQILWVMHPDKRFVLEFVGTGQGNEADDLGLRGQYLEYGLVTPRMMWNELDQEIPEILEDDPAMDMPGVWSANRTLLMEMQQMQQGAQQQQQAMDQQREAHQQQMVAQKMGQMGAGPTGVPGQPGGAFGNGPTVPPEALKQSLSRFGGKRGAAAAPASPGAAQDADQLLAKALGNPWV